METDILPKEQVLVINDREILVKKLPARKIIKVIEEVSKIPNEILNLDEFSKDEHYLEKLPTLIMEATEYFSTVLLKAVESEGLTAEIILDEWGADDITDVVVAIIEVNNVQKILKNVKKVQALVKGNA